MNPFAENGGNRVKKLKYSYFHKKLCFRILADSTTGLDLLY